MQQTWATPGRHSLNHLVSRHSTVVTQSRQIDRPSTPSMTAISDRPPATSMEMTQKGEQPLAYVSTVIIHAPQTRLTVRSSLPLRLVQRRSTSGWSGKTPTCDPCRRRHDRCDPSEGGGPCVGCRNRGLRGECNHVISQASENSISTDLGTNTVKVYLQHTLYIGSDS
jgi:hypothetical protein